ncbi:hypothetical protein Scep_022907 [Stephania cephalantha]|uniref:Uncharacterized protein n=1 Tax=Stephania cephalantha TaxID=152367 RepID=A0AAP0HY83_9MAGN
MLVEAIQKRPWDLVDISPSSPHRIRKRAPRVQVRVPSRVCTIELLRLNGTHPRRNAYLYPAGRAFESCGGVGGGNIHEVPWALLDSPTHTQKRLNGTGLDGLTYLYPRGVRSSAGRGKYPRGPMGVSDSFDKTKRSIGRVGSHKKRHLYFGAHDTAALFGLRTPDY